MDDNNEFDYIEGGEEDDVDDDFKDDIEIVSDEVEFKTYKNTLESISTTQKKTIPFLTKYEKARIVGVRLQQLANGAKPSIPTKGLRSIEEIVEMELKSRKLPFIVRRTLPNGKSEDWRMEEFEYI
jgi:DNA-directed RNA polymerase I, II, and III subunit RPABC2